MDMGRSAPAMISLQKKRTNHPQLPAIASHLRMKMMIAGAATGCNQNPD
jgi:hypothetical protein